MTRRLHFGVLVTVLSILLLVTACASDPDPKVEDFPSLLLGTWEQIGGPDGTLSFEGTVGSGIGTRTGEGDTAATFTYQWVAPATIRTDIGGDTEFTVLFEDNGDTLVLATAPEAFTDEIIRYRRLR